MTEEKVKYESVQACWLCGSPIFSLIYSQVLGIDSAGTFDILECENCSLAATSPRPTSNSLHNLYESRTSADFPTMGKVARKLRSLSAIKFTQQIKVALSGIKRPRILDFGCGDGFTADHIAKKLDAKVTCVDFHDVPPPLLKDRSDILFIPHSSLNWNNFAQYDLIVCRHVVEHLVDPLSQLDDLYHLLNPGGSILIEVPNFDCIWRKFFGRNWWALYTPRHLHHFTEMTLRRLCDAHNGLKLIRVAQSSTPVIGGSIGLRLRKDIANISVLGLILYPVQLLVELLSRSRSTLIVTVKKVG